MSIGIATLLVIGLASWMYVGFSIMTRIIKREVGETVRKELEKKGL
ncbi:MAG: hypothetical protein H7A25_02245 [Leptospiraceae bacterium]|nr:hypothetical protein [Leptospiraceae bacterium]MCP5498697.1 hypothetical protein [Leptospiraceae bacterium]